jgi:hypothetical protein
MDSNIAPSNIAPSPIVTCCMIPVPESEPIVTCCVSLVPDEPIDAPEILPEISPEMRIILKAYIRALNWFRTEPNNFNLGVLGFFRKADHLLITRNPHGMQGFSGSVKIYSNRLEIVSNMYRHHIRGTMDMDTIKRALIIMCNLSTIYRAIEPFNPETVEQKRDGLEMTLRGFSDHYFYIPYADPSNFIDYPRPVFSVEKIEPVSEPLPAPTTRANEFKSEDDLYG